MKTSKARLVQTRLGLYVTSKRDGDYFHIEASVVTIGTNAYERRRIDEGALMNVNSDKIRNVSDELQNGLFLNNLQLACQGNSNDAPRSLYAFSVRYQTGGGVDRQDCERMLKTLTTIEKRTDAVTEQFGHPGTFGQFVARIAAAIKADAIVVSRGKSTGWSYDDNQQRIMSIADGIYHIDGIERAWRDEFAIAAAEAR
jgi:hypothetical protein